MIHNSSDGKTHYGFNWCLDASGLEMLFRVPIIHLNIYLRIRSEEVMQKLTTRPNATPGRVIFDVYIGDKVFD